MSRENTSDAQCTHTSAPSPSTDTQARTRERRQCCWVLHFGGAGKAVLVAEGAEVGLEEAVVPCVMKRGKVKELVDGKGQDIVCAQIIGLHVTDPQPIGTE